LTLGLPQKYNRITIYKYQIHVPMIAPTSSTTNRLLLRPILDSHG